MLHWPWNYAWKNWWPRPEFPEVGPRLWVVHASTSHFDGILFNGLPGSTVMMIRIVFCAAHSLFMPCCILLQPSELWAYLAFPMERYCGDVLRNIRSRWFRYSSINRYATSRAHIINMKSWGFYNIIIIKNFCLKFTQIIVYYEITIW